MVLITRSGIRFGFYLERVLENCNESTGPGSKGKAVLLPLQGRIKQN
jgi:hypothetical protein